MNYNRDLVDQAITKVTESLNFFIDIDIDAAFVNNTSSTLNGFVAETNYVKERIVKLETALLRIHKYENNPSDFNNSNDNFNSKFVNGTLKSSNHITPEEIAEYLALCEQYENFYADGKEVTRGTERARNKIYEKMKAMEDEFTLRIFNGETEIGFRSWDEYENIIKTLSEGANENNPEYCKLKTQKFLLDIKNECVDEEEFIERSKFYLFQEKEKLEKEQSNYQTNSEEYKNLQKQIGYLNYAIDRNEVGELWYDLKEEMGTKFEIYNEKFSYLKSIKSDLEIIKKSAEQEFNNSCYETIKQLDDFEEIAKKGSSQNTYDLSELTYINKESDNIKVLYYYIATGQTKKADSYYWELLLENNRQAGWDEYSKNINGREPEFLNRMAEANKITDEELRNAKIKEILKDFGFDDVTQIQFLAGLENYFDGWGKWTNPSEIPTSDDFAAMYLQQFLSENYDKSMTIAGNVAFGLGNMVPTAALTFMTGGITSAFGCSTVVAKIIGKGVSFISIGVSSGGNIYEKNLQAGYDRKLSFKEAVMEATIEAGLEVLIGVVPGLEGNNNNFLLDIFGEVVEELIQEDTSGRLREYMLGEEYNSSPEEKKDTILTAFCIACIMQGCNITGIAKTTAPLCDQYIELSNQLKNGEISQNQYKQISQELKLKIKEYIKEEFDNIVVLDDAHNNNIDYIEEYSKGDFTNSKNTPLIDISKQTGESVITATNKIDNSEIKQINKWTKSGKYIVVEVNHISQLSSSMLNKIENPEMVKIAIIDGLSDGSDEIKTKYQNKNYANRYLYTATEAYYVTKEFERLYGKINQNLSEYEKANQICEIVANEYPYINDAGNHYIRAGLKGISPYNTTGKQGLVCAGYASLYYELCTASGIECHYVRGKAFNSRGEQESHAWNVIVINGKQITVDSTWHSNSKSYFDNENEFQKTHFSDADEIYRTKTNASELYLLETAIDVMDQKHGKGQGMVQLFEFTKQRNANVLTREGNIRNMVSQLPNETIYNFLINKGYTSNMLDYAITQMDQKEGEGIGIKRLIYYLNTDNVNYVPREGNIRDLVKQIPRQEITNYLRRKGYVK